MNPKPGEVWGMIDKSDTWQRVMWSNTDIVRLASFYGNTLDVRPFVFQEWASQANIVNITERLKCQQESK